jgi:hypothetical protein
VQLHRQEHALNYGLPQDRNLLGFLSALLNTEPQGRPTLEAIFDDPWVGEAMAEGHENIMLKVNLLWPT